MLFVISASVFPKNFFKSYLMHGLWVLQPSGMYALSFDNRNMRLGVSNGKEYKFITKKYYVSYQKVENFDPQYVGRGRRGNYIVFQDTLKTNNNIKYVTRNYRIKDLKDRTCLILLIGNKEYTLKYEGR